TAEAEANVAREIAADAEAAAEVPADNDAGDDVPLDGGAGAAEDVEEGRLQFDGPLNFKYRGRRFLYVKGSKHEGRLAECETCGDRFLVGIYKENKQRKAYANDDIDGHACLYEANAEEPVVHEPKVPMMPAFEDFKIVMNPDGSVAFKDAESLFEYNELRSKKAKHGGAGPSGSNAGRSD
ncbi:hypothetical protein AAVH_40500, partial [Aphelenchoides avenae]